MREWDSNFVYNAKNEVAFIVYKCPACGRYFQTEYAMCPECEQLLDPATK